MRKILGIKGEINLITIFTGLLLSCGGYITWTVSEAYSFAKSEISTMKEYRTIMAIRLEKLETKNEDRWEWIEKTMAEMNAKFDKITEVKIKQ